MNDIEIKKWFVKKCKISGMMAIIISTILSVGELLLMNSILTKIVPVLIFLILGVSGVGAMSSDMQDELRIDHYDEIVNMYNSRHK